jgi:hypothetical protein
MNERTNWKKAFLELEQAINNANENLQKEKGKVKEKKVLSEIIGLIESAKQNSTVKVKNGSGSKPKKRKPGLSDKIMDFLGLE